jgi:hypothetical protein
MARVHKLAALLLMLCLVAFSGCSEEGNSEISLNPTVNNSTVLFKNLQSNLQAPSHVQFTFRLTDTKNHAVIIEPSRLQSSFQILEDGQEIDYSETSYFVNNAAGLELDMVLLLDFTNSMASWNEDSVAAVDLMVEWARDLIDHLAADHRMAIMEYHDRNSDPQLVVPFTGSQAELLLALDGLLESGIDHGSSRNWDALQSAVDLFDTDTSSTHQRMVLFFTDGKETSSEVSPSTVVADANSRNVSVFIIAIGDVTNQGTLASVASQTDGELYLANDIAAFTERLDQIKRDLGGQYRVSYVTLKTTGTHLVKVQFDYQIYHGSIEQSLDLGSIFGDDRLGVLTFDVPVLENGALNVLVRAQHTPRNIDRFRFRLDTDKPVSVGLPSVADGGLLDGWQVADAGAGWFDISSDSPLPFGAAGPLWKINIDDLIESEIYIHFELDTTIYSGGKTFDCPQYVVVGDPDFAKYDFETGDIPPVFDNSSASPWQINTVAHAGNYSASVSGFAAAGASSLNLQTDVGFADSISFYLRIDNQGGVATVGQFEFYLDGRLLAQERGRLSWTRWVTAVTPGEHRFSWRFVVTDADLAANPQAWIDDIVLH